MTRRRLFATLSLMVIGAMLLANCAPAPAEAPPEIAPTEEAPAAAGPSELKIAIITCCGIESQWDATFFEAMERVKAKKPHGLNITWDWTDGVWGDDAEMVMREYAETGEYDIIWATSSYSDQVKNLKDEFPETMFVYHGSGNEALGDNSYWLYMRVHEAAYLLGMLAGNLAENDRVGVVGTFAFDDVNDEINAFFDGAKTANPATTATVSFIESWYDPVAGNEATNAQAAAGVDWILQLGDGWEACVDNDIMCFGNFGDIAFLAPEVVPASTLALWDPGIEWLIGDWWAHVADGEPWNGNMEKVWFSMAEGGSDITAINDLGGRISQDVIDEVMRVRDQIMSGELKIALNVEVPVSD